MKHVRFGNKLWLNCTNPSKTIKANKFVISNWKLGQICLTVRCCYARCVLFVRNFHCLARWPKFRVWLGPGSILAFGMTLDKLFGLCNSGGSQEGAGAGCAGQVQLQWQFHCLRLLSAFEFLSLNYFRIFGSPKTKAKNLRQKIGDTGRIFNTLLLDRCFWS